MEYLFWISVALVIYVYAGYEWVLRGVALVVRPRTSGGLDCHLPKVSVLLTVHNEGQKLESRIRDVFAGDFPANLLEVIVASDGSNDDTDEIALRLQSLWPVRLVRTGGRRGKTGAQNLAIPHASGEIIVFTDADARFARNFLRQIVIPFADPRVGGTTGSLQLLHDGSGVSHSQGFYWRYEMRLRVLESKIGILCVASGQAMAVRKSAWRPMPEDIGEDCIVPLDVVMGGLAMKHQPDAVAFDRFESESSQEFRTRARMTLRNWIGTWRRARLLNPFRHPGYSFSLISHKLLRWLSPFLIVNAAVVGVLLANRPIYLMFDICMALIGGLALLGWRAERTGSMLPVASHVYSFALANAGFGMGVIQAILGRRIVTYRGTNAVGGDKR